MAPLTRVNETALNSTRPQLELELAQALREPDPVLANLQITRCHYLLAGALGEVLGPGAGANFHSWAVWGSRKAGVTIRQEDLDQARRDGSWVGGIVGGLVGLASSRHLRFAPQWLPAGVLLGVGCGVAGGRWLIRRSRSRSASLILAGNRTVLADIGLQTAHFVAWLTPPAAPAAELADFLAGLPGQPLLRQAFKHYYAARQAPTVADKQAATYLGNCFAVWHEHERLEPYIRGAMPLIIRRCVTQRLLQFDIGARRLAVAHDVPATAATLPAATEALAQLQCISGAPVVGAAARSAARDWTRIQERMRYVFALFRAFHTTPEVGAAPYSASQLRAIAAGQLPAGKL